MNTDIPKISIVDDPTLNAVEAERVRRGFATITRMARALITERLTELECERRMQCVQGQTASKARDSSAA